VVKTFTNIREFFQIFIQSETIKKFALNSTDSGCWWKVQNYTSADGGLILLLSKVGFHKSELRKIIIELITLSFYRMIELYILGRI